MWATMVHIIGSIKAISTIVGWLRSIWFWLSKQIAARCLKFQSTVDSPDRHFLGRSDELKAVDELLQISSMLIVHGAGGCGKSELIKKFVSQSVKRYPGGCFQVDAAGLNDWKSVFHGVLRRSTATGIPAANIIGCLDQLFDAGGSNVEQNVECWQCVRDGLMQRAKRSGKILLFIDNVDRVEDLFSSKALRSAFQAGYSGSVKLEIIATARHMSSNVDENVDELSVQDLPKDTAVQVVERTIKRNLGHKERVCVSRIIDIVESRALYVRRIPALLNNDFTSGAYKSFEEIADAIESCKDTLVEELGEESYTPRCLWQLTCKRLLAIGVNGEKCIKLAGIIASLPINGVRHDIVRWLWGQLVNTQDNSAIDGTSTDLNRAIDILRRFHVLLSINPIRMHTLDRDAIYRDLRKILPEFMESVAGKLVDYIGLEDRFWSYMSDRLEVVQKIDITKVSNRLAVDLITLDNRKAKDFAWTRLKGSDWVRLLRKCPGYAKVCDWSKINPSSWVRLLVMQPQFAQHCDFSALNGAECAALVCSNKIFLSNIDTGKLGAKEWATIVATIPSYFSKCPVSKKNNVFYSNLLSLRPEFIKISPISTFTGSDWARVLMKQPQLEEYCEWKKFKKKDILRLVSEQSEFDDKIDFAVLSVKEINKLIRKRPNLLHKVKTNNIKKDTWVRLLCVDCRYYECIGEFELTALDWATIISNNSQLVELCPWESFDGKAWTRLLLRRPRYAYKCNFAKLTKPEQDSLVKANPKFEKFISEMERKYD